MSVVRVEDKFTTYGCHIVIAKPRLGQEKEYLVSQACPHQILIFFSFLKIVSSLKRNYIYVVDRDHDSHQKHVVFAYARDDSRVGRRAIMVA